MQLCQLATWHRLLTRCNPKSSPASGHGDERGLGGECGTMPSVGCRVDPKPLPSPPRAAPDGGRIPLRLRPCSEPRWAGSARCHQGRGLIHKSSAGRDRAWGGAGDGVGNRGCFVALEPAWRARACVEGAGGRGSVALWLKAPSRPLLAQLVAGLSPPAAPRAPLCSPSPCLGSAHPTAPLPCSPPEKPGRRAHSREWGRENPLY